ncbi:SAM-dependent methyltransferase [Radicibacter daui]|uniref:SAM-dependent methyltransferase n=1 Tax=Radicibacter daui TaxID=3064829 RepID=UPI0040469ECF
MSLVELVTSAAEKLPLPDALLRFGISRLVGRTALELEGPGTVDDAAFVQQMAGLPVAEHADAANQQHYELPPEFFAACLGPRRKYSCCLYRSGNESLAEAEVLALEETVRHAGLADGQQILELGCGWGSLSLFMAERFATARIVAVSNSAPQRRFIESERERRGLTNLQVITADMNSFDTPGGFDRVVSVEMFEHMANWQELLGRVHRWLRPEGRLFLHVFSHRSAPYRFDHRDRADWIAQHFFTGGIMPSHGLVRQFPALFTVEEEWRWSGHHYALTAQHWLERFDARREEIDRILKDVYGPDAALWRRRWRLFFLATAGLFGNEGGAPWGISHYRLKPSAGA